MNNIKAVIFDWDGVIADSMPSIADGIMETASYYGVNVSQEEVLDNYIQPREKYFETLGIDTSKIPEFNTIFLANIDKFRKPAPIFPEVKDALQFLFDKGLKLGIASTATSEHIMQELIKFELTDLFVSNLILAGEIKKEEKLKFLSESLGVSTSDIAYVGDLPSDIAAAKATSMISVGIERREKGRMRLLKMHPDYLLSSLNEIKSLFN